MKLIFVLLALSVTGCATGPASALKRIPPGNYATVKATITGKWSSTQVDGKDVLIDSKGNFVSGQIHLRHSNAYAPLVEFELVKEPALKSK